MKTHFNSLVRIVVTLSVVGITFTQAADQYWNPSPLTGNWANSVWSATSGGGSLTTWTASNNAIFDQAGTYTATINANQTATNINIKNGAVTFDGTHTVSSNNLTIDSGASFTAAGNRFLKSGTTSVTVNGTLNLSAISSGGNYIQLGGSGLVVNGGGFRHSGNASFGGNIQDVSAASRAAIIWNGGTAGTFTLSGNNSGMTGDVLMAVDNSVIKLNSANAIGSNSLLAFSGGASSTLIELAAGDFTRTWFSGSSATNNGGIAWSGTNAGFYATGADRNFTLVTAVGGSTASNVSWGGAGLTASTVVLSATAATHKLTWTNNINLNGAVRTFNTGNGSAPVDAALSGVLSGTGISGIIKSGVGTLAISGDNSYSGGTTVSAGTLLAINTTGSATGAGAVAVNGGTLGGTGSISGATTIGALGKLSPTAQASGSKLSLGSTLAFDSGGTSIFNWDLSAANTPDPGAVSNNGDYGQVAVTGVATGTAVFNIALLGGAGKTSSYADAFWDTNKTWNNLFASSGMTNLSTLFTSFTGTGLTPSGSGATARATAGDQGYFSFNGSTTLTWTAVPEPTSALAGLLLGAGLLRRRR